MALSKVKRKEITELVMKTINALDKKGINGKYYKELLAGFSDAQFEKWVKDFRKEDINFYLDVLPYKNLPTLDDITEAAKIVDCEMLQYIYFKHDGAKEPIRSAQKVPVGYIHVKRLQQLLSKKTSYAIETNKRNQTTGQLSGTSAVGRISDEESYAFKAVGADIALKELLGPRGDNRQKRLQLYQNIERDGTVRYADLEGDIKTQGTINYFNVLIMAAGLKTDLIENSEVLRSSVEQEIRESKKK